MLIHIAELLFLHFHQTNDAAALLTALSQSATGTVTSVGAKSTQAHRPRAFQSQVLNIG